MPPTVPVAPTVAIAVLLLLHVPVPVSYNAVVAPEHNRLEPDIDSGLALTVRVPTTPQPVGSV